jgi:hypothetical protein
MRTPGFCRTSTVTSTLVSDGGSGGYIFSRITTHIQFSDSSPADNLDHSIMPYTAIHSDTGGGFHGGNSLPQSEATSQPLTYSPEHDQANAPPCCVPAVSVLRCIGLCIECDNTLFEAALPVHSYGYAPQWNAPAPCPSVQDQRYSAPVAYVNDVACGYGVWSDAQERAPFAPAKAMASINPS